MVVENLKMYSAGAPLFIVLLWTIQSGLALDLHCLTETGSPGTCVFRGMCDSSSENSYKCGTVHHRELECCPVSNHKSSLLPEPPHCGLQREDNIDSEQSTTIFEFPWLARFCFEPDNNLLPFACTGSLINDRYVLTAASCVASPWTVQRVRLGEWDLDSEDDCQGDVCSNAPIDVGIEQIVVHNNYDRSDRTNANNIALVRLNQTVSFSLSVQPICLPLPSTRDDLNRNELPTYVGGWSFVLSRILYLGEKQKVEANVTSLQECAYNYGYGRASMLDDMSPSIFCAKTNMKMRDEACVASFGSPLMRKLNGPWYQIGVDGNGWIECEVEGRTVQKVYTNVTEHINWIKDNVY